jgi:hypothetical protein
MERLPAYQIPPGIYQTAEARRADVPLEYDDDDDDDDAEAAISNLSGNLKILSVGCGDELVARRQVLWFWYCPGFLGRIRHGGDCRMR